MIEYKLIRTGCEDSLGQQVTEMLNEGWSLYEAPIMSCTHNGRVYFIQAVTKNYLDENNSNK